MTAENQNSQQGAVVLLDHRNAAGVSYLARLPDGRYRAGFGAEKAKEYPSARAVYDAYFPQAASGHHGAFNICYYAQDEIQGDAL